MIGSINEKKRNTISFKVVAGESGSNANNDEDSDDDSEMDDEPRPPPSIKEVQVAMEVMQLYSLRLQSTDVAIQLTRVCSSIH